MWRYGRGQPRKLSVAEAEARLARRQERTSASRQQAAATLKWRLEQRGADFYERQRQRRNEGGEAADGQIGQ